MDLRSLIAHYRVVGVGHHRVRISTPKPMAICKPPQEHRIASGLGGLDSYRRYRRGRRFSGRRQRDIKDRTLPRFCHRLNGDHCPCEDGPAETHRLGRVSHSMHYDEINPIATYSGLTVAMTEVLPAGGVKPAGCVIDMVVAPTAIGSNAVLR
jgi:hypothetical protein